MPNSVLYGLPWLHLPDGSVTFREAGFVAASSASMLRARHNYELADLPGMESPDEVMVFEA